MRIDFVSVSSITIPEVKLPWVEMNYGTDNGKDEEEPSALYALMDSDGFFLIDSEGYKLYVNG